MYELPAERQRSMKLRTKRHGLNKSAKMFVNSNSLSKSSALRGRIVGFDEAFLGFDAFLAFEFTWLLANASCIIAFQLLR